MKPVLNNLSVRFSSLACAAVFVVLAGCSNPVPKAPHVRMETVSHTIAFNDGVTRLNPAEQDALASFVSTIPPSAVSSVALAADDMSPRAVARARSVRDYLVRQGFDKHSFRLYPSSDMDARTVVVSVQYAKALPPQGCPDWSKTSIANYDNSDASGFGCAYYNNLIVQLANPADYNGGHGTPVADGARDSVVLQRYLADTPQPSSGSSSGSSASSGSSGASSGGSTTTTTSSP